MSKFDNDSIEEKLQNRENTRSRTSRVLSALALSQVGEVGALFSLRVKRARKHAIAPHLSFLNPSDIDHYTYTDLRALEAFYAEAAEETPEGKVFFTDGSPGMSASLVRKLAKEAKD